MMLRNAYFMAVALGWLLLPVVTSHAVTREYFIAAEDVTWDYAPAGKDLTHQVSLPPEVDGHTRWRKTRFIEYTDVEFHSRKTQPAWLGILGPIIRAEVGDTIIVHFKNKGSHPYSMHPHGLRYTKDDEGADYRAAGRGASVAPGNSYTYTWIADERSGPGPRDAGSTVWWYHSHVDEPEDVNAGLLGPIIVTAQGNARQDGSPKDVQREFITLFMIFIETEQHTPEKPIEMMSINGYVAGNLSGFDIHQGDTVRWYVLGMGDERDLHTAHWHGETVEWNGRRTDVVELLPASMVTVNMAAHNTGAWMYHCHVAEHMKRGMHTTFTIHK